MMSVIDIRLGDSREVLKTLADNSIDSVVTDPPYALVSIGKRFGAENAAPAKSGKSGAYQRASAGFMNQKWDTGETAFAVEFWAEVMRVLKPGGHVVAFSGTRTYHRLACAVEDAGFEIRDMLAWLYGSGFPKSHDVSKGIDKHGGASVAWFGPWFRKWREENGVAQKQVAALFPSKTGRLTECVANWELGLNLPTPEQFNAIKSRFGLPFDDIAAAERAVVGQHVGDMGGLGGTRLGQGGAQITAAGSEAARQWQGWGTALKPACEPIVLARKPLAGTVAANVLAHGTGALNIDACRIGTTKAVPASGRTKPRDDGWGMKGDESTGGFDPNVGRWPANVIHDGSEEVTGVFPSDEFGSNPSRFFYTAKADATERLGTKHPTVKPTDLMAYLIRLVTPPGGTVLDPFAGSGSTGVAAVFEGFNAVLIEREPEYFSDIERRIEWAKGDGKLTANQIRRPSAKPAIDGDLFPEVSA